MSRWAGATGKVHWKHPFKPARMVINVPTPVVERDRLFVSAFYDGSFVAPCGAAEEPWPLDFPEPLGYIASAARSNAGSHG